MKNVLLTGPQLKALEWLDHTGEWKIVNGGIGKAVNSLVLYHPELAEVEYGDFGKRGGRKLRCRLTSAGIQRRAVVFAIHDAQRV